MVDRIEPLVAEVEARVASVPQPAAA